MRFGKTSFNQGFIDPKKTQQLEIQFVAFN